jgi:hypothetical protein
MKNKYDISYVDGGKVKTVSVKAATITKAILKWKKENQDKEMIPYPIS